MTSLGDLHCVLKFLDGALVYHQFSTQGQACVHQLPEGNGSVSVFPGLVDCFVYLPNEQKHHARMPFGNILK